MEWGRNESETREPGTDGWMDGRMERRSVLGDNRTRQPNRMVGAWYMTLRQLVFSHADMSFSAPHPRHAQLSPFKILDNLLCHIRRRLSLRRPSPRPPVAPVRAIRDASTNEPTRQTAKQSFIQSVSADQSTHPSLSPFLLFLSYLLPLPSLPSFHPPHLLYSCP